MHKTILFIHLVSLIVAYGTIMFVDFYGLFWAFGKRTNEQVMQISGPAQVLVWGGLLGLVTTGIIMRPDLSRPLTIFKMAAVFIIVVNGFNLDLVQRKLKESKGLDFWKLPKKIIFWSVTSLVLSQLAWMSATIAGFIIANS